MSSFFRIGDKLLNRDKLDKTIDRILDMRISGVAQQEVAQRIGCDRSFISRLEGLAEVRRGGNLAVIGFPLANTAELHGLCQELGVDYILLMTDNERWELIQSFDGQSLLNWLMKIIAEMNEYDYVIMIGSDMRIRLAEAILGEKVFGILVGESPIKGDVHLQPGQLKELIISIKGD